MSDHIYTEAHLEKLDVQLPLVQ